VLRSAERGFCGLITALFPDECRVCGESLREVSRIPVCSRCLHEPEAMDAEFFCVACKTPFLNEHPLDEDGRCTLCRLGAAGFDGVYTFGSYEGTLRTLVHLFKFEKVHTLAKPLGELLARSIPREERFDAVVAMPLHWRRRWTRGFNQSDLLAREIARRWGIPVVGAVRRVKATVPQAALTNAKRRKNVSGAFAPSRRLFENPLLERVLGGRFVFGERKRLQGARVLLIDDVMTTGATAAACARALKRAGAKHVTLAAVARTDRRVALTDFETAEAPVSGLSPEAASRDLKSKKTAGGITT
jgi:ComF family protein